MNQFDAYRQFTFCRRCGADDRIVHIVEVRLKRLPGTWMAVFCDECLESLVSTYFNEIDQISNLGRANVTKVKEAERVRRNGSCSHSDTEPSKAGT